jgi:hypothetical protein
MKIHANSKVPCAWRHDPLPAGVKVDAPSACGKENWSVGQVFATPRPSGISPQKCEKASIKERPRIENEKLRSSFCVVF